MIAYEYYWRDETGKEHLMGILPERRSKPERVTRESIFNWGWRVIGRKVIGSHSDVKNFYFVPVEMQGLKK